MHQLISRRWLAITFCLGTLFVFSISAHFDNDAHAQSSRSRSKSKSGGKTTSTKTIDVKAEKLQDSFLRSATSIAREYEDAGDLEKAKTILETIVRLDGSLSAVKAKIKSLNETILNANEYEFTLDPGKGWTKTQARVFKGQSVRIQTTGDYKLTTSLTVEPQGVAQRDPVKDMVGGIPLGAVMGMVVAPPSPTSAKSRKQGPPKLNKGRPFTIGKELDLKPAQDGVLFLRVNVPPGSKCTGKIRVQMSGHIRPT